MSEGAPAFSGPGNLPHPRALAFLGDAVFEIFLRELAVRQGLSHSKDLHTFTSTLAKASAQVSLLHALKPFLTEAELEIVRQGRNVGVGAGRRADQAAHRQATGFEALIGALYLQNPDRLAALWTQSLPLLEAIQLSAAQTVQTASEPTDESLTTTD